MTRLSLSYEEYLNGHSRISHDMMKQRMRLGALLYRHVHEDDVKLSDMDFLKVVWARVEKEREQPLIDPNE